MKSSTVDAKMCRWKKIGGGSLRWRGQIIKAGQIFYATEEELPKAFQKQIVPVTRVPRRKTKQKKEIWYNNYFGFGDQINMRPFVMEATKRYDKVYLSTAFPELYYEKPKNLFFVKPRTRLRLQMKNLMKQPRRIWVTPPSQVEKPKFNYGKGLNILDALNYTMLGEKNTKIDYDLPVDPKWIRSAQSILGTVKSTRPVCIIKYPTLREEWKVETRLPKTEYIQLLIDRYKNDYCFISVADTFPGVDDYYGELKGIDLKLDTVDIWTTVGLVYLSNMVIAWPSFFIPLCIALRKKAFFIFGGYHKPENYTNRRMDLSNYAYVAPVPFCNCLKYEHDCNKNIEEDRIITGFEKLRNRKENLLIVRLGGKQRDFYTRIATNKYIAKKYTVSIMDIERNTEEYDNNRGIFQDLFIWRPDNNKQQVEFLTRRNFCNVIIAQKLHSSSDFLEKICQEYGINYIWTEAFFDNRLLFDKIGLQYTPDNEIVRYIDKIKCSKKIRYPSNTRTPQEPFISKEELYQKYKLKQGMKYIVMFGQTVFDMSLKHSLFPGVSGFQEYVDLVVRSNPEVTFIYKDHPHYKTFFAKRKEADVGFIRDYSNVIEVDEHIDSLFNAFDYFTAFSSTTIFEGLVKGKKFATMGYHFCNDARLVHQMKEKVMVENLYEKLKAFCIDKETRRRYIYFVCNYYAIPLGSKQLVNKLELSPDEYYRRCY